MKPILVPLLVGSLWVADALRAQASDPESARTANPPLTGLGSAPALGPDDRGELRGSGRGYEVVFRRDAVQIEPALGVETERPHPFGLRLASIGRARGNARNVTEGERTADALRVRYRREWFDEVYDVRTAGVEQSFVFRSLPPGEGDLVVRLLVDTDLEPHVVGDGMEFRLGGAGGARIGAVTGIDARGARVAGSMSFEDGVLELSLPGAFVESAALPLVLDPLIGSTLSLSAGLWDEREPDVAYDASSGSYLVVWEREVAGVRQVRGQRVDRAGTNIGSTVFVETTSSNKYDPKVANVNLRDGFVVCWNENSDIRARGVLADGTVGPSSISVAATSAIEWAPDIGGEASTADDDAIVVWHDLLADNVLARQVTLGAGGQLVPTGSAVVVSGGTERDSQPCISKSGGAEGRFLICWRRQRATDLYIWGAVVDRNLGFIDASVRISNSTQSDNDPACDGDGTRWVVAWERRQVGATNSEDDIYCCGIELTGRRARVGRAEAPWPGTLDEQNAAVGWAGNSALLAFSNQVPAGHYHTMVGTIDPFGCTECEDRRNTDPNLPVAISDYLAIATEQSGGAPSSFVGSLVVWSSEDTTSGVSSVTGRLHRAEHGQVVDLGGGCGAGGSAHATCAVYDNADFTHRLRGSVPHSNAALVFSFFRMNQGCASTCSLIADPFRGFTVTVPTDEAGHASVAMPMPGILSVIGVEFLQQWLVVSPSPQCASLGVDFSNALLVRIQ